MRVSCTASSIDVLHMHPTQDDCLKWYGAKSELELPNQVLHGVVDEQRRW